jgi:hypothetical protein
MQLSEIEVSSITSKFEKSQNDLVVQSADFSLQGLKEMVDSQIIDLDPKYQRRERWDTKRQWHARGAWCASGRRRKSHYDY